MTDLILISFGYLYPPAPVADLTLNVREYVPDPHTDPELRELTGHDQRVRKRVLDTRGIEVLITTLYHLAEALVLTRRHTNRAVTIAIGCAGGRHRSVVLVNELTQRLALACWQVESHHRDLTHPAVNPPTPEDPK